MSKEYEICHDDQTTSDIIRNHIKEYAMFDLEQFVRRYVTKRQHSIFLSDIQAEKERLAQRIEGKTVLVIGGAGHRLLFHQSDTSI